MTRVNNIAACLCPNSNVNFTATIIRKTVVTSQRELSCKYNANIESGQPDNVMTHLRSTSDTHYALQDRTDDAMDVYKFIRNQVHCNYMEPQYDDPVEPAPTSDKSMSTSSTNANQPNSSSPSSLTTKEIICNNTYSKENDCR